MITYLTLLGEGIGAFSAIAGRFEINLSVGRKSLTVLDDKRQTNLCLYGICSCALYLLNIAPTLSCVEKKLSSEICN